MAEPFQRRSAPHGPFARLAGRVGKASFMREIEDVLARAPRVSDVPAARLGELAASHGVDFGRYRSARCKLYRRLLEHCLVDRHLSADESADLVHLRALLQLDDTDVAPIHDDVVQGVYGGALDEVVRDHRLDPEEAEFLRRLGTELKISPEVAERLYHEAEGRARRRFLFQHIVRDDTFLAARGVTLELNGVSERGFEDAIRQALDEANRAYPGIVRAEVAEIAVELEADRIARWHVKLKSSREPVA